MTTKNTPSADADSRLIRFLAKVDDSAGPDSCHLWTASKTPDGYGYFVPTKATRTYAHRWILGYQRGKQLGRNEYALHTCDNPSCVNPAHLYIGDQRQNVRDAIDRGRFNASGLALGRVPGKTRGQYRVGKEACGSVRGYSRHRQRGEETCSACRAAIAAYHRVRRAAGARS